ncbi:MFS transporter [Actinoallomurus acanthiterrae]
MATSSASQEATDRREHDRGAGAFAWYRTLGTPGRRAFKGAYLGYGLDSYDFWVLPLGLTAIAATFGLSKPQTGMLATTTLVFSALGGIAAGVLADRVGRARTLMVTVIAYAVCTALCGLAPNYPTLLVFRALQGLGFGGEWAAGAILVAEYAAARHRGRAVAMVQSAWAVGWGAAALIYTAVFGLVDEKLAWRLLFITGALPAVLAIYVRRSVTDAPTYTAERRTEGRGSLPAIFGRDLRKKTLFAVLMSTGVQGGYYTLATWVPTYLKTDRHLSVVGTGAYLAFLITGAYAGYLTGGHLTDRLGRKLTIRLFAVLSGLLIVAYTQLPASANDYILVLGFPLGFCSSAIFSGFGSFLSELYPGRLRGTGQGFTYNVGRGVGAFFPTAIGFIATRYGVGGAMAFGALAYVLAFAALFGLPETRAQELS